MRHAATATDAVATPAPGILCGDLIGATVKDCNGRKIGAVKDLVFDRESSALLFAILSFDGSMSLGSRYRPLPWHLIRYDQGFVVGLSSEQLQGAPSFSIGELVHADDETRRQVYAYYART